MVEGGVTAYILVVVSVGEEHNVAERIASEVDGVIEVGVTYGEYDLVVKAWARTFGELDKIVTTIRNMEGVRRTTTLISSSIIPGRKLESK